MNYPASHLTRRLIANGFDTARRQYRQTDLGGPNEIDTFVGFRYWRIEFGVWETPTFKGTEGKAFLAGIAIHVF